MKRALLVLLLVPLAGCFGAPDAPDYAETDRHEELPGLKLSTWTDEEGDRWRVHALVVNDSEASYNYRVGCGEPWDVSLAGPAGAVEYLEIQEEPGCASQWEVLRPKGHIDTLYSWDFRDHDPEAGTDDAVPPGQYRWRIEFHLRDRDEILFTEHFRDVTAAESGWIEEDPEPTPRPDDVAAEGQADTELEGFWMDIEAGDSTEAYTVRALVRNDGQGEPTYWRGCLTEWDWELLGPDGAPVHVEPWGTCAGFQNTTFAPGEEQVFSWTWNGQTYDHETEETSPAPAGEYRWRITFRLRGMQGPTMTGEAAFVVTS